MIRILHTDDDKIVRFYMKIILQKLYPHFIIDEAVDGESALKKIKENDYHLIISDINMPKTDPLVLVSDILSLKPGSKILMFSTNDEELYAHQFLKLGAIGYLKKDAPQNEIKNAIDNCLNDKKYLSPSFVHTLTNVYSSNSEYSYNVLTA